MTNPRHAARPAANDSPDDSPDDSSRDRTVHHRETLFLTGATGLVGGAVLRRMLAARPQMSAFVLVRDLTTWNARARALGSDGDRITPVVGDLRAPGFGVDAATRAALAKRVTRIVHAAADTRFSQTHSEAAATNIAGTRHLLELAAEWHAAEWLTFVSTAFVAGTRTGVIGESRSLAMEWVNAYEWSKHMCESLVHDCRFPWVIVRPSTIVCDSTGGAVRQINAVHRALRLYHHGLAPMLPGLPDTLVDVVPADFVATAIARLSTCRAGEHQVVHLCAGDGAITIADLLDITYDRWASDPQWRRRGVTRPALTGLETYRLFERTVEEGGDARLVQVMRSLSHFAPQLAYPKRFETANAQRLLGHRAPAVRHYWPAMLDYLVAARWAPRRAAA